MTPLDPSALADLAMAVRTSTVLPPERKRELQTLLMRQALTQPLQFRPAWDGGWIVNGGRWRCEGVGAFILQLLALNPGRELELNPDRSLVAWATAIGRARDSLILVDPRLAAVMASAGRKKNAPGVRLRTEGGRVFARWHPPPNLVLALGCVPP